MRSLETDLQSALVRPKVTYADFSALLTNGSGFQKSDGSWLSKNDVTSSPEYMNRKSKYIEDVTAVDAPVQDAAVYARISGTEYKESVNVQYKARTGREFSLMPDIHFRSDVTPSASCQWYQVNSDGSMTEVEDASDMALHLSPTIPVGTYTYAAEITCGGYICYSDPYTVTVTPRELELTVDEDFISKVYDGTADVPDIKPIFIAAGGGDLPEGLGIVGDVGHNDQHVHPLLKGQVLRGGEGHPGGGDALHGGVVGQVGEQDRAVNGAGALELADKNSDSSKVMPMAAKTTAKLESPSSTLAWRAI